MGHDVVLCSDTAEDAEARLEAWREAMEIRGMKVSRKKTEYLCMQGGESFEGNIRIQDEIVPRKNDFKYLGSTIQADGGSDKEVARRIQAGWNSWRKITGVMCDKKIPDKVKGKMYKMIVRPAMLYGIETLPLTKTQEQKLETTEMKMLRFSLGITRKDRVRNKVIRSRLKVGSLREKVREARLRWLGHVRIQKRYQLRRKKGKTKTKMEKLRSRRSCCSWSKGGRFHKHIYMEKKIHTGNPTKSGKSLEE